MIKKGGNILGMDRLCKERPGQVWQGTVWYGGATPCDPRLCQAARGYARSGSPRQSKVFNLKEVENV